MSTITTRLPARDIEGQLFLNGNVEAMLRGYRPGDSLHLVWQDRVPAAIPARTVAGALELVYATFQHIDGPGSWRPPWGGRSVSVGDVIRLDVDDHWIGFAVQQVGFEPVTTGFRAYTAADGADWVVDNHGHELFRGDVFAAARQWRAYGGGR